MAYCVIIENPHAGPEQFEQVVAHLRSTGSFPPDGQRLLVAGPAEPGWRVITVWDSREAEQRFETERLAPACQAAGVPFEAMQRTGFDPHTVVAGDLVGA